MAHPQIDHEPAELTEPAQLVNTPEGKKPRRLYATALARHEAPRRLIVPAYIRNPTERSQVTRWLAGYFGHIAGYHATRTPKYAIKCLLRAPIGAFRLAVMITGWVLDREGLALRLAAVASNDPDSYMRLSGQRNDRAKLRITIVVSVASAAVLATLAIVFATGGLVHTGMAIVTVIVLAAFGSPKDQPLLDRAVVIPQVQRLTDVVVLRALASLGIAGISQAVAKSGDAAISFPAPITRDGPGWRADIDLPYGVTCTDIIARREKLASGLARPLGCVWPSGDASVHPGRLVLLVRDKDLNAAKQPAWPLAKTGATDLFEPLPAATNQRGDWVNITLMFASVIIGAVPRIGKTYILRELLLLAALDPRVQVHCFDLKGTGDLSPLEPVAHCYGVGDEAEDIDAALADLRGLVTEMRRRAKVIRGLPKDLCPENKITPELASKRSLGLHPIVVGVDECQIWFDHDKHAKEFEALCTDLVKRGPAVGIILMLATQRPDAKSIPTGISANATLRICLKVMGQPENDMILGTSSYHNGVRATSFTRRDLGIAILSGEGDEPIVTRWVNIDAVAAQSIALRARTAREQHGRLTGYAAGDQPADTATHKLLDDVLHVVNMADGERVWSETVCRGLAELRPDVYDGWAAEQLAAALRPHGVGTIQIWLDGRNRRGVDREQVLAAIEAGSKPALEAETMAELTAANSR